MDARLYDDVLAFTECIKETPEYREYIEKKRLIAANPELLEKAEQLKKENMELISSFEAGKDTLEELMRFADKYEDAFLEPVINDYLLAEAAFCKMMREILTMTMERIDF
ncbi:MAG: YlbF family regulator [Lachnospiraceae bacterium]|nr:YlbF family regulator [Lachnospiraceae bacterium]